MTMTETLLVAMLRLTTRALHTAARGQDHTHFSAIKDKAAEVRFALFEQEDVSVDARWTINQADEAIAEMLHAARGGKL